MGLKWLQIQPTYILGLAIQGFTGCPCTSGINIIENCFGYLLTLSESDEMHFFGVYYCENYLVFFNLQINQKNACKTNINWETKVFPNSAHMHNWAGYPNLLDKYRRIWYWRVWKKKKKVIVHQRSLYMEVVIVKILPYSAHHSCSFTINKNLYLNWSFHIAVGFSWWTIIICATHK